jgi:hypothetical protein
MDEINEILLITIKYVTECVIAGCALKHTYSATGEPCEHQIMCDIEVNNIKPLP